MRNLTLATVAAAALVAGPVLAQTPAPAPAAAAPAAPTVTEADIEAAATAFQADMEKLGQELDAAKTAAGSDTAKANADADAIVARHQPAADAFADKLKTFIAAYSAMMPPEAAAQMPMAITKIQGAPAEIRAAHMAAPGAPAAPATPPAN